MLFLIIVIEHVMFVCKFFISSEISDVPNCVQGSEKKRPFIQKKADAFMRKMKSGGIQCYEEYLADDIKTEN